MTELPSYKLENYRPDYKDKNHSMLLSALLVMAAVVFSLFFYFLASERWFQEIERPYLIPWVIATGLVIVAPSIYLIRRKKFSLTHPLVFAAITYFFPIFFLGGWSLTFGLSNYFYLNYVTDPEYNFPLAFAYVMTGFGALSLGFFIPKGKTIGNYAARRLPVWEFKPQEIVITSIFFLGAGFFLVILALELGQIGYQSAGVVFGETGSLNYYLTIIVPTSTFLLWLAFFKFKTWNIYHLIIAVVQIFTAAFMLIVLGGKSSLLQSLLLLVCAFVLAGRKILFKHWFVIGFFLLVCLFFGAVYGTKFRTLKANDERVSVDEYVSLAVESLTEISDGDLTAQVGESFGLLAERLEITSSLAVVVANYESLHQYEASYGLDNNIWTYTWTAFIPRFLWKDKPLIADNYSYNELYFDHGGYGLAITAMGDLLRNFGPVGVPLGMILLGFCIRIFYATFIEDLPFSIWRSTIYFIVLMKISYDSFYGEILPTVIRVAVIVFVQLFILKKVIYALRQNEN